MRDLFDEIREQIHEIRNLIGPFDLKMANLEHQISANRIAFEARMGVFESKLTANTSQLNEQGLTVSRLLNEVAQLSERVKLLEFSSKAHQQTGIGNPAPVREDKQSPAILPPQNPTLL